MSLHPVAFFSTESCDNIFAVPHFQTFPPLTTLQTGTKVIVSYPLPNTLMTAHTHKLLASALGSSTPGHHLLYQFYFPPQHPAQPFTAQKMLQITPVVAGETGKLNYKYLQYKVAMKTLKRRLRSQPFHGAFTNVPLPSKNSSLPP